MGGFANSGGGGKQSQSASPNYPQAGGVTTIPSSGGKMSQSANPNWTPSSGGFYQGGQPSNSKYGVPNTPGYSGSGKYMGMQSPNAQPASQVNEIQTPQGTGAGPIIAAAQSQAPDTTQQDLAAQYGLPAGSQIIGANNAPTGYVDGQGHNHPMPATPAQTPAAMAGILGQTNNIAPAGTGYTSANAGADIPPPNNQPAPPPDVGSGANIYTQDANGNILVNGKPANGTNASGVTFTSTPAPNPTTGPVSGLTQAQIDALRQQQMANQIQNQGA